MPPGKILKPLAALLIVALVAAALINLWLNRPNAIPEGFASGNGRIEATEIDIATKQAGRLKEVLALEGDVVDAGQILARMDIENLEAELREAEAQRRQAREGLGYAEAIVAQRESELEYARAEYARSVKLSKKGYVSSEELEQDRTAVKVAEAALRAAKAQVVEAEAAIDAAGARADRIRTDIDDSELKSPIGGRVLYRLAEPGEVLPVGGKVFTVLQLTDVYMTIFLPTAQVGRVRLESEARIVLDAAPEFRIPARVSFISAEAQFTPKEVETRTEREKLMFRVKVKIDPELLEQHIEKVKTGLPGVAYVRTDPEAQWPESLQVRLPP